MEIMCSGSKKSIKVGQVWMLKYGEIIQITYLHSGYEDKEFQARYSGEKQDWCFHVDELDYLISKE